MKNRGVQLQYTLGQADQRGADIHNPLFDLLSAVHEHGSIQHAAKAMGASKVDLKGAGTTPRHGIFALAGNIIGVTNSSAMGIAVK